MQGADPCAVNAAIAKPFAIKGEDGSGAHLLLMPREIPGALRALDLATAFDDQRETFDWEIIREGSRLGFRTPAVPKECRTPTWSAR